MCAVHVYVSDFRSSEMFLGILFVGSHSVEGLVAQWIRHRPKEPGIAGSSPAEVMSACEESLQLFIGIDLLSHHARYVIYSDVRIISSHMSVYE